MEKRIINPWQWQDKHSYVQAVEVKHVESTLYISGQTAINAEGVSSNEDMGSQLTLALQNLEKVISDAGYEPNGIVRLSIYTTSMEELGLHFNILHDWLAKYGVKHATTVMGVNSLYETTKVELEATVVK
ncbi:MAG: RidA family protein [Mucilaginibacter sp.]|uniref:RidA family protein n=1 Tax=Mucilaginibacter sp. TaxID=1882438 RepID=UPI003566FDC6